jgi:hypothetical protein
VTGGSALTALVHLVGFGAGAALYAMLGALALRAGPAGGADGGRPDHIPLATAALGVCWSVGALVLYPLRDLGLAPPTAGGPAWLVVVGSAAFAALGFLPAVAVEAAAQPLAHVVRRAFTAAAYGLSATAALLQAWGGAVSGALPARPALLALTVGYVPLLAALAVWLRRQPAGRAPLTAAALAAFAVAALHLRHHGPGESPVAHLAGDHASIPLALVILYQDYRFAFADLVLKRTLAGVAAVAAALGAYVFVFAPLVAARTGAAGDGPDAVATAVFVGAFALALVLAPRAWRAVDRGVDRLLLGRGDYAALRRALGAAVAAAETPEAVLDAAAERLADALGPGTVTWSAGAAAPDVTPGRSATVPVATADAPGYVLRVGPLGGGRRLLSDDLALLEWAALQAARRVDVLRAARDRFAGEAREHEAVRLAAEAELRALRAQLNPHFLFNALTTIGHLVQTAPDRALATLYELTGLLRAVLRSPDGAFVPLGDELAIVEAYLAIEGARFEERLRVTVDADDAARAVAVPPLLVQPLVENAVKHGVAPLRRGAAVRVWARVEPGARPADPPRLRVRVSDDGAGADPDTLAGRRAAGLGLSSVERRLAHTYGGRARFAFRAEAGAGATAEFELPVAR